MTIEEAKEIKKQFDQDQTPSEEDKFIYTEAMDFLISETSDPYYMMELGGWYYEQKDFRLAKKYYEMAAALDDPNAYLCLGYIWYYGRTGEPDNKQAFECYSKAAERGSIVAEYKLADMYKNGYYVKKDYEKYKEIIEKLYEDVREAKYLSEPLPEIFTRLAAIRAGEGRKAEAAQLYLQAEDFLAQRIRYNPFFGNLSIMKYLIEDLYKLLDFDWYDINFYDLYYALQSPVKVTYEYTADDGSTRDVTVASKYEDGGAVVEFEGKWFRSIDAFFAKAEIDGHRVTEVYDRFYMIDQEDNYE